MWSILVRRIVLGISALLLISCVSTTPIIPGVVNVPQVPAFLPTLEQVPAKEAMSLDGLWLVNTINKKIKIEGGRAYAVDSWLHLFVLTVDPGMVVIKDINATAPGKYSGYDLPLIGNWSASVNPDRSLTVSVTGAAGPAAYKLIPIQLDNPQWYAKEMQMLGSVNTPQPQSVVVQTVGQPEQTDSAKRTVSPRGLVAANSQNDRLCADKGGEGQYLCTKVPAIDHGVMKLGCPGRNNYLSDGKCYSCPTGYKRASLTRKMTHPQACKKGGLLEDKQYKPATLTHAAFGCSPRQFNHLGHCKTCPAGTTRKHLAGIDSGNCKVPRNKWCIGNLEPAKLPPDRLLTRFGNWVGAKVRKRCAAPFNISAFANQAVNESPAGPIMAGALVFSARLLLDDKETKRKVERFKNALKAKEWSKAWNTIKDIDEFNALVQAAEDAGDFSISVGVSGDVSVIAGYTYEHGLALDFVENRFKGYHATALTKGLSVGGDVGIVVGVWEGKFETSYSQGIVADLHIEGGVNGGVWASYYNPGERAAKRNPYFLGFTVGGGAGYSAELGEYNEVYTKVLSSCSMGNMNRAFKDNVVDIAKLVIGKSCS